ncbi:4-hydroxythreonine-4-phosphate dehydrogenase [Helicobacter enhydrae]|uniref:4-hydroxythreonine-4-phosphate dehydrogenase n=1 Tax=Helicobacter enhydrae TaxID=222136 RepID=A0A1B1U531_9HELI|nr:4-hydroxythreonine-4-phosphate dehydrogenase [Helicobacter enhydrae]ANV97866.1 4-hydroxythreonine-4-phosphate dehydrogenase [Helicobacter enhydrae]
MNQSSHPRPKIAISCGDINGVGLEILLKSHQAILDQVEPIYCVHFELLQQASQRLNLPMPDTLKPTHCLPPPAPIPQITPSLISKESGLYSYESFILACTLCETHAAQAITTLPIHKKAWNLAGITEIGHTEALSKRYKQKGIMMLGCEKMFVALFSDHIPLKEVASHIKQEDLQRFFVRLFQSLKAQKYCVMGLNPHCGDGGIIGDEDSIIAQAIKESNAWLGGDYFVGPIPCDCAFIPSKRQEFQIWVGMYHDIALSTLKALYFDESINVTLGIDILRTSVDHGVAFDIAYSNQAKTRSYLNAIAYAKTLIHQKEH